MPSKLSSTVSAASAERDSRIRYANAFSDAADQAYHFDEPGLSRRGNCVSSASTTAESSTSTHSASTVGVRWLANALN